MNPSWESITIAVALAATMAAYAIFAGADFGGGVWDLLAGGSARGSKPRAAIDASMTPVWEGNQTWIVLGIVLLWTGFPMAFAAVMTTLFVPLALSVLGIVLRGVGFAFRHESERLPAKRLTGGLFAMGSIIAPFFLGVAVGAVASGRVSTNPSSTANAWVTPTALVTGALFVATSAFIGAVYLVGDSHRRGEPDMVRYFSRRAAGAGVASGALAAVNLLLLHGSAKYVFHRLVGAALPLVILSFAAGLTALVLIILQRWWGVRIAGALAVTSVVGAWAWAQYPWVLPQSLSIKAASATSSALLSEIVVLGLAVLLVLPAFAYLYWLQQHGQLEETSEPQPLRRASAREQDAPPGVGAPSTGSRHPVIVVAVVGAAVREWVRDIRGNRRRMSHRP